MGTGGPLALLRTVRYEVLPAKATEEKVLTHVPRDVVVTVTASPVKGLEPTLDLAGRLAAHGYRVVPHVPARLLRDDLHLKEVVDRLREAGVDDVFVPAGDADPPAGSYDGALPERCAMRKALPITADGVFNALRMITKNVLAIDPATGQTADWIMGYLVVPVPTPIVVHAGDAPSVAFGYRPGDELHAFTGSLEATLPRVDLRDTTELATR